MPATLYEAVIPTYLQTLGAMKGLLDKAQAYCAEKGLDEAEMIDARLADDMQPFSYQVKSTAEHSIGSVRSLSKGVFNPVLDPPPNSFAALHEKLDDAIAALRAIDADEFEQVIGADMAFELGEMRIPFTAENFLFSFSLPNFYFHATTAYAIMRMKGVKIGKRDFLGVPRMRG